MRKGADILTQYADALARVRYLRKSISNLEEMLYKLNTSEGAVSDVVTCGKKRRKPLGTVRLTGLDVKNIRKTRVRIAEENFKLKKIEEELLELLDETEEYIESIEDLELRNIFTLYYIEDMTWLQVAVSMNELYNKKGKKAYTESACRQKHDRFLKKNS